MSNRIPILTYHSIDDSGSIISTTPGKFRSQMHHLRDKHFNVVSLNDIVIYIRKKLPLPPRSIAITFDDGFKNVYNVAYPVLRDCGFSATVFLVPGRCGRDNQWEGQPEGIPVIDLLDWEEVREMANSGIDFGAHTMGHIDLTKFPVEKAREEIVNSKLMIQKHLEKNVQFFAYPYGRLTNETKAIIQHEFSGACSVRLDFVTSKSDLHALPRIDMYYFSGNNYFTCLGTSSFSHYIKYRKILRSLKFFL